MMTTNRSDTGAILTLFGLNEDNANGFIINDEDDRLGSSLSSAGDINGDGIDDLIISGAGSSYVIFGSSEGLGSNVNLSTLNGSNGFVIDTSGWSVSSAGDINGDNIDDLIIGGSNSYVIFGSNEGFSSNVNLSTLNGSNGFVIDNSGWSVSSAGDINGDGIDDLIIGEPHADSNGKRYAGESYVIFGSSEGFGSNVDLSTLNGSNGFVINGIDKFDRLGTSVSSAGDINGDGIDDLIIGAPRAEPIGKSEVGESYVIFGSSEEFGSNVDLSTLNGSNGFVINGIYWFDYLGTSVSSAGDVNGDGLDDLIIGAPRDDTFGKMKKSAQESYVIFGSSEGFGSNVDLSTLNGSNGFVINGIDKFDKLGTSVSSAGDINGDGIDDLIIGAPGSVYYGIWYAGESYVIFGSSEGFGSNVDLSTLNGSNGFVIDNSGNSVSSAGDINGDDIDDLIIRDAGETYVIFGSSNGYAPVIGELIEDQFSAINSLLGSFTFEINDNVFRDPDDDIVSYSSTLADDTPLPSWLSFDSNTATYNGTPLSGDIGVLEIKLTATDSTNKSTSTNFTLTVLDTFFPKVLELESLNGSNGFVIEGIDEDDKLGSSVSSAGDVNGDGIDDLIIGAPYAESNGNINAGSSYVVFGSSEGFGNSVDLSSLNGSNGFVINGIDARAWLGTSVSSAGDVNGDGIDDLVIGAPDVGSIRFIGNSRTGKSYVVFGSNEGFGNSVDLSGLNGSNGFVINGIDADDRLGTSVSSTGDINGDGIDDLIIGAPGADPHGNGNAGKSYVIFGTSEGFGSSVDLSSLNGSNGFVIEGIYKSDCSGLSVSSAGDINGDGIDDLIIGAPCAIRYSYGESYVVFGNKEGFTESIDLASLDGSNGFLINLFGEYQISGVSVSSAGDINGDGIDDLIIGAIGLQPPKVSSGSGGSYIVFGSSAGFAESLSLDNLNGDRGFAIPDSNITSSSDISVSSTGDINGDGIDDLIIGASRTDPNGNINAGQSNVIFGSREGFAGSLDLDDLNGKNGFTLNGINENDKLGTSVSSAGDVNGDGIDDLIIGAPGTDSNGKKGAGSSYVVFGIADTNSITDPNSSANAIANVTVDEDADNTVIDLSNLFIESDFDDAAIKKRVLANTKEELVSAILIENQLTLDYQAEQSGTAEIIIQGESKGKIVTATFTVTVNPADDLPIVSQEVADIIVKENAASQTIDLSKVFTDVDGDEITFAVKTNSNDSLVSTILDGSNLTLDFVKEQFGNAEITLEAQANGKIVEDTFSLTVNEVIPPNNIPTLENPLADTVVAEDSEFSFIIPEDTFKDVDAEDSLNYAATLKDGSELPSWLTFDAIKRTFSGTPNNSNVGSLELKVTATDNDGESVGDRFVLMVENVDDAPVIKNAIADITVKENADNSLIDLLDTFTDIDNDDGDIIKGIPSNSNSALVTTSIEGNNLIIDYQENQSGTAEITVRGTSNGQIVEDTFKITVKEVNTLNDNPISSEESNTINTIKGGVGNDTIFGKGDNNSISGGEGDDFLVGFKDNDLIKGENGHDYLVGYYGDDSISGGEGDDLLLGNRDNDTLDGGTGNDTLVGGMGDDLFVIELRQGQDLIKDFVDGIDLLGLGSGLTFDNLTIVGDEDTQIIDRNDHTIAILSGVSADEISKDDFVTL